MLESCDPYKDVQWKKLFLQEHIFVNHGSTYPLAKLKHKAGILIAGNVDLKDL
jgi:hypothetical protein